MAAEQADRFNLRKRLKSFRYAFNGIKIMFSSEHNSWIHLFAATLVLLLGFYFQINTTEWILVIIAITMVLATELINSAIEMVIDLISPDYNTKAGKAKDMAAGAVLICAIAAACIGIIIFLPYFIQLF